MATPAPQFDRRVFHEREKTRVVKLAELPHVRQPGSVSPALLYTFIPIVVLRLGTLSCGASRNYSLMIIMIIVFMYADIA